MLIILLIRTRVLTLLCPQHRSGPSVPVSVFVGDVWLRHRRRIQLWRWRSVSSEAFWTAQQSGLLSHLPPRRKRQHDKAHRAGEKRSHSLSKSERRRPLTCLWVNLFQARHTTYGIRKCFLFLLQCQLSLVIIQVGLSFSHSQSFSLI